MDVGSGLLQQRQGAGADLAACDSETCRWQIANGTGLDISASRGAPLPRLRADRPGIVRPWLARHCVAQQDARRGRRRAGAGNGRRGRRSSSAGGSMLPSRHRHRRRAGARGDRASGPGDGVLVLMDLGSAVLSAEIALDMLPEERRERVVLSEAPLVGGRRGRGRDAPSSARRSRTWPPRPAAPWRPRRRSWAQARPPLRLPRPGNGSRARSRCSCGTRSAPRSPGRALRPDRGRLRRRCRRYELDGGTRPRERAEPQRDRHARRAPGTTRSPSQRAARRRARRSPPWKRSRHATSTRRSPSSRLHLQGAPARRGRAGALVGLPGAPGIAFGAARHFRVPAPEIPTTSRLPTRKRSGTRSRRALERARTEIRAARDSVAARAGEYERGDLRRPPPLPRRRCAARACAPRDRRRGATPAGRGSRGCRDGRGRVPQRSMTRTSGRAVDVLASRAPGRRRARGRGAGGCRRSMPGIVLAADLTPADTAALDSRAAPAASPPRYGGADLARAILARALGIPAVVGARRAAAGRARRRAARPRRRRRRRRVEPDRGLVRDYERRREREEAARRARACARARRAAGRPPRRGRRERRHAAEARRSRRARRRGRRAAAHRVPLPRRADPPSEDEQAAVLDRDRRARSRAAADRAHARRRRRQAAAVPARRRPRRTRSSACAESASGSRSPSCSAAQLRARLRVAPSIR